MWVCEEVSNPDKSPHENFQVVKERIFWVLEEENKIAKMSFF